MFYQGYFWKKYLTNSCVNPQSLEFGMYHYLVDPYQVRSKSFPGVKNVRLGVTCSTLVNTGKTKKIFLPETTKHRALLFGM